MWLDMGQMAMQPEYWWELIEVGPQIAIEKILADLNLAVR